MARRIQIPWCRWSWACLKRLPCPMMVPWPQYGHRRGSICNGISLTPDRTCFRSLVNATKRITGVVARLALDHLCRVRIARLAFPCPQNQYRTKKEYIFSPSSRRILPQSTRLAGLERNIGSQPGASSACKRCSGELLSPVLGCLGRQVFIFHKDLDDLVGVVLGR